MSERARTTESRRGPRPGTRPAHPPGRAGDRRTSRRHRVRRRRDAGEVGGCRMRHPSPRVHRRLKGHVGRHCRHRGARRPSTRRATGARPRRSARPARSCSSDGAMASSSRVSRNGPKSRDGFGCFGRTWSSATIRGAGTDSIRITVTPASSPAKESSPLVIRTSSPSTGYPPPAVGAVAVGGRRSRPRGGRDLVARREARRARVPTPASSSRRCTRVAITSTPSSKPSGHECAIASRSTGGEWVWPTPRPSSSSTLSELAGLPAGAGRPRERLGDRDPSLGERPIDDESRVPHVAALGHDQAEVQSLTRHPIDAGLVPCPSSPEGERSSTRTSPWGIS